MARSPEAERLVARIRRIYRAWFESHRTEWEVHVEALDDRLDWCLKSRSLHRVQSHLERQHDHEMAQIRRLLDAENA